MRKMNKRGQADIAGAIVGLLSNVYFYIALLLMGVTGVGMRWMRKLNLTKGRIYFISAVGILFATGLFSLAMLGTGTAAGIGGGIGIERIQTTTAFHVDNDTGGTDVADSGIDDTRMSDFYLTEVDMNSDGVIEAGVFAVTRSGNLNAASCPVTVLKPARYEISDTTYHIVNEDADTGVMDAHILTGASSAVATTAHPKETTQLAFDEGVAVGYVSFSISLDETGFDPLTQYDYKDVNANICGYPYTWRIHKNDA